jgi:hypothetical protein
MTNKTLKRICDVFNIDFDECSITTTKVDFIKHITISSNGTKNIDIILNHISKDPEKLYNTKYCIVGIVRYECDGKVEEHDLLHFLLNWHII